MSIADEEMEFDPEDELDLDEELLDYITGDFDDDDEEGEL